MTLSNVSNDVNDDNDDNDDNVDNENYNDDDSTDRSATSRCGNRRKTSLREGIITYDSDDMCKDDSVDMCKDDTDRSYTSRYSN